MFDPSAVCEDDAIDRPVGGDRDPIDHRVDRVAQIFEARDERDLEFTRRELPAKRRWMIEVYLTAPTVNERPCVKIPDAAETHRSYAGHIRRRLVRRRPGARPLGVRV